MKTDELVALLATGADAVEPRAVARRHAVALAWGGSGACLLMLLLLGVRPDLRAAAALPMFWVKLAFPAGLAAAALLTAARLARPGAALGWAPAGLAAPVIALWLLAAVTLAAAAPDTRGSLLFGGSWEECLLSIPLLSAPVFVATLWAMRGLAPTRPVWAGAAAGLLAGAVGALVYALHCPEMAAPFLAAWYLLGMLIPAALGALVGPHLLRW